MTEKERRDFCIECRKETEYLLRKKDIVKNIRDKEYTFAITVAVCAECGEEMSIPGLIDRNVQEIDEQPRQNHAGQRKKGHVRPDVAVQPAVKQGRGQDTAQRAARKIRCKADRDHAHDALLPHRLPVQPLLFGSQDHHQAVDQEIGRDDQKPQRRGKDKQHIDRKNEIVKPEKTLLIVEAVMILSLSSSLLLILLCTFCAHKKDILHNYFFLCFNYFIFT